MILFVGLRNVEQVGLDAWESDTEIEAKQRDEYYVLQVIKAILL